MATAPDQIPDILGRYRVGSPLGEGGFAVVLRAHDEGLDAPVAIKVLDPDRAYDPDLRERFVREARLLRRVQNPNVVAVYDIGELDDGRPYFVMEFAGGGVVGDRFRDVRATDRDIQTVVLALRSGLGALHRAGIVHRDIKPDNLLIAGGVEAGATRLGPDHLDEDERIVIGDLGLAKDQQVTGAGPTIIGGTPRFRAPEQLDETATVTPATDTYAATGVLWQLVTGTLPPDDLEHEIDRIDDEGWAAFFRQGLSARADDRFEDIERWAEAALAVVDRQPAGRAESTAATVAVGVCPYKGLAAFQPEDAGLFFGREALVDELIRRLQLLPTLVVAGPSGSGKSSLVRAGLLPAVERGALSGSHQWPVALLTPGVDPVATLHRHLERIAADELPSVEALRADPRCLRSALGGTGALVVIDQFEEVFTAPTDDEHCVVALLAELTRPEHQIRLVLALRADFYDRCAAHPWLARVINDNQVLVGPMQRSELRRAIEAPARRAGLRFEDGLVDRVLDDAGNDAGTLPLVAHALMETWLRRKGNELTLAGYEAAGGVTGAIAQSAETAIARLDPDEAEASSHLFLRLVNPSDDNVITRRHLPISDLEPSDRAIVDEWAQARLLTIDEQGVEITHEAMLDTWPRLRQWIDDSRDDLRTRQRISRAADSWRAEQRDPALLYRGTPLEAALAWADEHHADLSADDREFLDASAAQRDDEQAAAAEAQARQQRRRRRAVVALAVLAGAAVIASVLAVVALAQSRQDEQRAVDAEEEANLRLAEAVALQDTAGDPLLAVMLAAEAVARAPRPPVGAMTALVEARTEAAEPGPLPVGDLRVADSLRVAMSPNGETFAVGTRQGTIELRATEMAADGQTLAGHDGGIEAIAFSPDGNQLASTGIDGAIVLWDLTASPPTQELIAELGTIGWNLAYDADGGRLAVVSESGELRVFDTASGDEIAAFEAGMGVDLLSVAFVPGTDTVIAGSGQGTLFAWSLDDSTVVFADQQAHTSDVWELEFDESGDRLMTVSSDGRVRIWDVGAVLRGEDDALITEPLTGDGDTRLVTEAKGAVWVSTDIVLVGADDGSLWRIDTTGTTTPMAAVADLHSDRVLDLAASDDGSVLVSVADDQVVRTIDNQPRQLIATVADLGAAGHAVALDPTGRLLAGSTADGRVVIVDPEGGVRADIGELDGRVSALAFVDDTTVMAGDANGGLHRLAVEGGGRQSVAAHDGEIHTLAVDPDGSTVVTVGQDGAVRAWSTDADLTEQARLDAPTVPTAVAFIDGDTTLLGFADGDIARWTIGDDAPGDPVTVDMDRVWTIAADPTTGNVAVGTGSERVSVRPLDDLETELVSQGDLVGGATGTAFLRDGTLLATVSREGAVRFLDIGSGQPIGPAIPVHIGEAWGLISGAEGAVVHTVGTDGTVRRTDVLDLEAACLIAGSALADPERRQLYLSDTELVACAA